MLHTGSAILTLAFGLGLLHALDADHIAAVSAMAMGRRSKLAAVSYSALWAIGHSLTLLLVGGAVLLLGQAIPAELSHWAELLVGAVLILIGIGVLRDLRRRGLHFHFHHHDDLPMHAHWHEAGTGGHTEARHGHRHKPLLVGTLHGAAGSAPLLAVIPISSQQDPWLGMAYLLIFSLGVLVAMLSFGGVLGWMMRRVLERAQRGMRVLQTGIGTGAILLGAWVIHAAV